MSDEKFDSLGRHLTLAEVGDERGSQRRKARSWGIAEPTFSQVLRGMAPASLDFAAAVEVGTEGRVPAISWRQPPPAGE